MKDSDLNSKLSKLGYSKLWLLYGILSTEDLAKQINIFDKSQDKNPEHYRYAAFHSYLTGHTYLSDVELNNYLELVLTDKDQLMASSAAIDLFKFIDLTESQFDNLTKTLLPFRSWTEKIIKRETLKKRLRTDIISESLFIECMKTADSVIQEILLTRASSSQLLSLVENGLTKKIRNIANVKLEKMKHH